MDVDQSLPTSTSTSTGGNTSNDVGPVGKLPSLADAKRMPLHDLLLIRPLSSAPSAECEYFNLLFRKHPTIVKLPYHNRDELANSLANICINEIESVYVKGILTRQLKHYFEHDHYIPQNDRKYIKKVCKDTRSDIATTTFKAKTNKMHSENPEKYPDFYEYKRKNQKNGTVRKAAIRSGAKNLFYFLKHKHKISDHLNGRQLERATRFFKDIYGKKRRDTYVADLLQYMVDKGYPLETIEEVKRIRKDSLSLTDDVEDQTYDAEQASALPLSAPQQHFYDQPYQDIHDSQDDPTSTFPSQSSWGQTWHGTSSSSHGNIGVASNTFNPPHLPDTYDWGGDYIYDPAQQFNFSPPTANNMDMTDGYLAHLGLGPENLRDDLQYLPSSMGSYNPGAVQNLDQYLHPMHLGYESAQPHASSLPVPDVIHQQQQHHIIEDHSQVPFTYYANPYSQPAVEMPPEFLHQSHQMPHTLKSQGHFSLSRHQ